MPVSVAVSNPPPNRLFDFSMDQLTLAAAGAGACGLIDQTSGRTIAFTQVAGAPGRAFNAFIARNYVGFSGGVGGYAIPFTNTFALPAGNGSPTNPVHIFGVQFLCNTVTLSPAGADQGIFFKATTGAYGAVYVNSVAYGVIPADERAFGVNRNVTGGYDFVSVVGGVGRVTTPLAWPNTDARYPVDIQYRIFEATQQNPQSRFELYLNGILTLHDNMIAGNALGLPFNMNAAKPCWVQAWAGFDAARQVGATDFYYRCGPTLADVLQ